MTSALPVMFIADVEPRVRRRWWAPERRARKVAQEVLADGSVPPQFVVALRAAHPRNPYGATALYAVGHIDGLVTMFVTTTAT